MGFSLKITLRNLSSLGSADSGYGYITKAHPTWIQTRFCITTRGNKPKRMLLLRSTNHWQMTQDLL